MQERVRSIVTRLRSYLADRRAAPRRPLRLSCAVAFHDPKHPDAAPPRGPRLDAHTRDLSLTGLALIVPSIRIGERYLTEAPLRILIDHPSGALQLVAQPVRYEQLPDDAGERGYLLGLHITEMDAADRARFEEHLRQLR